MLSANWVFYFFTNLDSFYLFFSSVAVTKTSKLCWIIVVRVETLVLFLIVEEILSAFHHCGCFLWVCCIWPLLCWGRFLPFWRGFFFSFNHERVLNFVKDYAFIETIILFLSFNLIIQCITLFDLCIVKNPCIPEI